MKKVFWLISLSAVVILPSCSHDVVEIVKTTIIDTTTTGGNGNGNGGGGAINPCDPSKVYFVNDVLPIFLSSCAYSGCHDAATHKEGVILDNYANIMSTGGIRVGNAWSSHVYESITESNPEDIMPPAPKSKLDATQITTIARWINEGALNNYCDDINNCDTVDVKYSTHIEPIINNYCKGCHSGASPSGGLKLTNYDEVMFKVNEGSFLGSIKGTFGWSSMPKGVTKLSACNIRKIEKWIQAGALNN